MAIGSGLGASFGVSKESTYGTYVAPTRFFPGTSFNIKKVLNTQPLSGVAAGRLAAPDEVVTTEAATGRFEGEVPRVGFGLILEQIFGTTVTPAQQAATTAYLQSHVLADNRGKSLTIQKGVPDVGGTANPYTGYGAKIMAAEFSCGVDELLTVGLDLDVKSVDELQTLATPSYTAGNLPFHFAHMSLKLGTYGSEATVQGVKKVSMSIARPQDSGRFYAGNAGLKSEPIMNDWVAVSGTIDVDFVTKADFVDRFVGHNNTALDWIFEFPTPIASTYKYTFRVRCPKVYFGGDIPEVSGPDVNRASIPFTAFLDTTNGLVSASYISTDVTV